MPAKNRVRIGKARCKIASVAPLSPPSWLLTLGNVTLQLLPARDVYLLPPPAPLHPMHPAPCICSLGLLWQMTIPGGFKNTFMPSQVGG